MFNLKDVSGYELNSQYGNGFTQTKEVSSLDRFRSLDKKGQEEYRDWLESSGQIAPKDDGFFGEVSDSFNESFIGAMKGIGATANEFGLGSGMQDYFEEVQGRNRQWNRPEHLGVMGYIGRGVGGAAGSTASIAPAMFADAVLPTKGALTFAAVMGQSLGDNVQYNRQVYGDNEKAWTLALFESAVDAGIETCLGTVPMVGKSLKGMTYAGKRAIVNEMIKRGEKELGRSGFNRFVRGMVKNVVEEGVMEEGSQYLNTLFWRTVGGDPNAKFDADEMLENIAMGSIGGGALGMIGGGRDASIYTKENGKVRPWIPGAKEFMAQQAAKGENATASNPVEQDIPQENVTVDPATGIRIHAPDGANVTDGEVPGNEAAANTDLQPGAPVSERVDPETGETIVEMPNATVVFPKEEAAVENPDRTAGKEMMAAFYDENGIKHSEMTPEEQKQEGVGVVTVDGEQFETNGMFDKSANEIKINPDNEGDVASRGHEFDHLLTQNAPDLAEQLHQVMDEEINERGEAELDGRDRKELYADMTGKILEDPETMLHTALKGDEIHAGFGERFLRAVVEYSKKMMAYLKKHRDIKGAEQYFNNYKRVRDTAVNVLAEYHRRQSGNGETMQTNQNTSAPIGLIEAKNTQTSQAQNVESARPGPIEIKLPTGRVSTPNNEMRDIPFTLNKAERNINERERGEEGADLFARRGGSDPSEVRQSAQPAQEREDARARGSRQANESQVSRLGQVESAPQRDVYAAIRDAKGYAARVTAFMNLPDGEHELGGVKFTKKGYEFYRDGQRLSAKGIAKSFHGVDLSVKESALSDKSDKSDMSDVSDVSDEKTENAAPKAKIEDFGEKIEGARKDLAVKTGSRDGHKTAEVDGDVPAWRKKYFAVQTREGEWQLYIEDKNYAWGSARPVTNKEFGSKEDALAAIPAAYLSEHYRFYQHGSENNWAIYRRNASARRLTNIKDGFKTKDEAMTWALRHVDELAGIRTTKGEKDLLVQPDYERTGERRMKRDVTPEDFGNTFGFRGVQFGNWENQDDRQQILNDAYEALYDLADLLNIPPKAISLNGQLGAAFGARGHGGDARAHFEPGQVVINLTKPSGAGTFAHEWMHALDNYFRKQATGAEKAQREYLSEETYNNGEIKNGKVQPGGMRQELFEKFKAIKNAILDNERPQTAEEIEQSKNNVKKWRETVKEQLAKLRDKLADASNQFYSKRAKNATAEQLKAFDDLVKQIMAEDAPPVEWTGVDSTKSKYGVYRYTSPLWEKLNDLCKEIVGRSGFDSKNYNAGYLGGIVSSMAHADNLKKHIGIPVHGRSQFFHDAGALDSDRSKTYWSKDVELFARAFSSFIEDKLKEQGRKSEYLSYGSDNQLYHGWKPFPEGEERTRINQAFQDFFDEMKYEETSDGKVRLYSTKRGKEGNSEKLGKSESENENKFPSGWGEPLWKYENKGIAGVSDLRKKKSGFIPNAWVRPDIGGISLPYGMTDADAKKIGKKTGYGLAHIDEGHEDLDWSVVDDTVLNGKITQRDGNRIIIERKNADPKQRAIIQVNFDEYSKNWLVTIYAKEAPMPVNPLSTAHDNNGVADNITPADASIHTITQDGDKSSAETKDFEKNPLSQQYSSASTSQHQIAATFKKVDFAPGSTNLDIGGGKYDDATQYLAEKGVNNLVFDPFNRGAEQNQAAFDQVKNGGVDTVTCNNVLNVIAEPEVRSNVILQSAKALKPGGSAYFLIHEGDKSGVGRPTKVGAWQNNRKANDYIDEIKQHFADVVRHDNLIVAQNPIVDGKQSTWSFDGTMDNSADYSIKRHKQVNPIREEGDAQQQHEERIHSTYETKSNATLNRQAESRIVGMGGVAGTIKAMLDGDFAVGSDVSQRVLQVVLNSEEFKNLSVEDRNKISDIYVNAAGTDIARSLAARRLGVIDLDDLKSIQAHVNAFLAKIDKAKPDNTIREDILDEFDFDIDNLPPELVNNPDLLDKVLRKMAASRANWKDKAYEFWINSILSGPSTHVANTIGNVSNAVYELGLKRLAEAFINVFAHRKNAATFGEFKQLLHAVNWRDAGKRAKVAFNQEILSPGGKLERARVAIGGTLGRVIRVPGRLLRAADEFAKAVIQPMEAAAFAYREGVAKKLTGQALQQYIADQIAEPSSEANAFARQRAIELTFQEDPGKAVTQLINWRESGGAFGTLLKFTLPFIKTPANIMKQGVRKSIYGGLWLVDDLVKIARGKKEFDAHTVSLMAEQLLAWGAVAMLAGMGDDDDDLPFITGTSPAYGSAEQRFKANKVPPYSIRIGKNYYSYKRIEPLATGLAFMADGLTALRAAKNGEDGTRIMKNLMRGGKQLVVEKSFLQNLGEINRIAEDPERSAGRYFTNFAASWMPNVVRQTVNVFDDNVRDNKSRSRGAQWWEDQFTIVTNSMGLTKAAPKYDYFGREITKDSLADAGPLWQMMRLVPIQSVDPDDNMNRAEMLMWRYNQSHPDAPYYPDVPAYYCTRNGKKLYFDGEYYGELAQRSGQLALKQINNAFRHGLLNDKRPTEKDIELIKKIFSRARKEVRDDMIKRRHYSE